MPTPRRGRSPRASIVGFRAYCWPRDAIWVGGALDRLGHHEIGRGVYQWLNKVRQKHRPFLYWFQKYSIDGVPEWETPAVDQTALIPWGLERHYRRTGDLDFVASVWPMIEQACKVCCGDSGGHPGLRLLEDLQPDQLGRQPRPAFRRVPVFERLRRGGPESRRPAGRSPGPRRNSRAVERLCRPDLEPGHPAGRRHQPRQGPRV